MTTLNIDKIIGLLGLLIAVFVGVGVSIPNSALLLFVCGVFTGHHLSSMFQVRVIVSALGITAFSSALTVIPEIGKYLEAKVANIGKFAQGSALFIISCNFYLHLMPVKAVE
jgi:hypothetical protein